MIKVRKFSSNYVWLLDNGHGGLINGVYQTAGKRSPVLPDGRILYEGVYNRIIVNKLIDLLQANSISYCNIVPEDADISLKARCDRANSIHSQLNGKTVYVSIHANAFSTTGNLEFNSANGVETFHFLNNGRFSTVNRDMAAIFQKHLVSHSKRRDRGVKGANFYVLRETNMPAVLTESPFMTNLEEARLMLSDDFQNQIALAHFNAILEIENRKLFG